MQKTYTAPVIVAQGDVVEATRLAGFPGTGDPDNPIIYRRLFAGTVGFLL